MVGSIGHCKDVGWTLIRLSSSVLLHKFIIVDVQEAVRVHRYHDFTDVSVDLNRQFTVGIKLHMYLHSNCRSSSWLTFPFSYRSLRFARNASSVISSNRMKSGCPNSADSESAIVSLLQEGKGS